MRISDWSSDVCSSDLLGFHAFNIIKRPGELTFGNFFYGAPIGAPAALVLASALNVGADALSPPDARFGSVSRSPGRVLGALTAAGIAGTVDRKSKRLNSSH